VTHGMHLGQGSGGIRSHTVARPFINHTQIMQISGSDTIYALDSESDSESDVSSGACPKQAGVSQHRGGPAHASSGPLMMPWSMQYCTYSVWSGVGSSNLFLSASCE
jgi:hypothetical protein